MPLTILRALPLALLAASPLPAKVPAPPRPALWKVADADTTIYLFGTIHVLPAGLKWRDAAIDKAIAQAQSLMLETVLDRDPGEVGRVLASLGTGKGLPPLAERVPPAKREALAALVAQTGVPSETLDRMKSWAAAVVLTGASFSRIGLGPGGEGVEPQLSALFRAAGKPIEGLETPEQQLGFFDALPENAQRAFLVSALDDPKAARADFDRMVAAWIKGDVAAIARAFAEEPEFTPQLRDLLVKRRDQAWAEALAQRLARPGTIFVAVGAGHLAGPDSVQHMLALRKIIAVRMR
ncbi:TraB/GumN family protein [Sphingomonas bacterium]|uniref:TraB/GumN family protein n=1 Tax=Sphingomonas bacterium TaxID=1895847 RepID=UPI0015773D2D|nr:TraB/GumN family protein [Sphingomonas bacterium]